VKQILRGVAVLAVTSLLLLGFASTANAQTTTVPANYPPVSCTVRVIIANGTVTIIIICTGFTPGVTITITIDGAVAGETVVAPDGTAVLSADALACGTHELTASDGTTSVSSTFEVPCPATPVEAAGTLPFTGDNTTIPFAQIGLALLAVGALTTVVVRKRRAAQI
jgi:LPXTG-motif cell wall-anchored protein